MRLDVFTQIPHAFAWLTEHPPVANVLGTELELRLFNYRDTTPLRGGQVDDEPYGGGAGMVLRVDVVAAALEAVYGDAPPARVVALTPQGRQLDQRLVEELAAEPEVTLLSSRFEGFDERIVDHLCTDAVSIGPYVLSCLRAATGPGDAPVPGSCGSRLMTASPYWPEPPVWRTNLPWMRSAGLEIVSR